MRAVLEIGGLEEIEGVTLTGPLRAVLPGPLRGGPKLTEIRAALGKKGRVRFSGTSARIFVDLDPGEPELISVALDTIVRSDPRGLERMILSVLGEVDEIVIGVDGRSDAETRRVAEAYADTVWSFEAEDLGLSADDWSNDRIDFAAARNLGREKVHAPWALVVDSDEYILRMPDLRETVRRAEAGVGAFGILVRVGEFEQRDSQRLARTSYRWWSATHNQLSVVGTTEDLDALIVHDATMRGEREIERRTEQRRTGVEAMAVDAAAGQMVALYHLAKHKLSEENLEEGQKLTEDYRSRAEPHGPLAHERSWLALGVAALYYNGDKVIEAELWALRAMLDGPSVEAFCLLGDLAEERGDLLQALAWYESGCALPGGDPDKQSWRGISDLRWGRLAGIRRALGKTTTSCEERLGALVAHWRRVSDGVSTETRRVLDRCAAEAEGVVLGALPPVGNDEPSQSGEASEPESDAGAEARCAADPEAIAE